MKSPFVYDLCIHHSIIDRVKRKYIKIRLNSQKHGSKHRGYGIINKGITLKYRDGDVVLIWKKQI